MKKKEIDFNTLREACNYILDNSEDIVDEIGLVLFLEDLKDHWNIFTPIYNLHKLADHKDEEKAVIDKLSQYIREN